MLENEVGTGAEEIPDENEDRIRQHKQRHDDSRERTVVRSVDGSYISWREHLIDDVTISGVATSGSDGLAMADLDLDGHLDVVSVHESDTSYDGVANGHVRIAFGSDSPDRWLLATLADGAEAQRRVGTNFRAGTAVLTPRYAAEGPC